MTCYVADGWEKGLAGKRGWLGLVGWLTITMQLTMHTVFAPCVWLHNARVQISDVGRVSCSRRETHDWSTQRHLQRKSGDDGGGGRWVGTRSVRTVVPVPTSSILPYYTASRRRTIHRNRNVSREWKMFPLHLERVAKRAVVGGFHVSCCRRLVGVPSDASARFSCRSECRKA